MTAIAHDLRDTTGSALREARRRFCASDDWLSMIAVYTAANQRIYGPSARAEHDAAWEAFKAAEAAWEAAWADYYRTKATA